MIGFGARFFKDGWNVFDFVVILLSLIGFILSFYIKLDTGSSATVIRTLRIARMFKMFRKQKSLQVIFETFLISLPAIVNVGGLLMLLIYIFTVLTMNLFAPVKLNNALSENANF